MKKLLCIYYLFCIATLAYAQDLRFNANGKFKIIQFTDVHYIFNDSRAEVAIERINEVLSAENPDLVMFTGDIIYGKPAEEGMRTVLEQVSKRKIPFAVTFGNHDDEQGLSREELLKIIQRIPYSLTSTTRVFQVQPTLSYRSNHPMDRRMLKFFMYLILILIHR